MTSAQRNIIDEFFIRDGFINDGFERRSVLLQLLRDMEFTHGIGSTGWVALGLDKDQRKVKKKMLPLLTPVLLFCSAVDLLARIESGRLTDVGENGDFFKDFLIRHFNLSNSEAKVFWQFRCSITHQYLIPKNVGLLRAGSHRIIEKIHGKDLYFIYVNSQYTSLTQIKQSIYHNLKEKEQNDEKNNILEFINNHGFILQRIETEYKTAA